MKNYLLLHSSEDGEYVKFLNNEELDEFLEDPFEYIGVSKFLKEIPEEEDPGYWDENIGLLLEIKVLRPRCTATKFKI